MTLSEFEKRHPNWTLDASDYTQLHHLRQLGLLASMCFWLLLMALVMLFSLAYYYSSPVAGLGGAVMFIGWVWTVLVAGTVGRGLNQLDKEIRMRNGTGARPLSEETK